LTGALENVLTVERSGANDDLCLLEIELPRRLETRWHSRLEQLTRAWEGDADHDWFRSTLGFALRRCDPDQHRLAQELEWRISTAPDSSIVIVDEVFARRTSSACTGTSSVDAARAENRQIAPVVT